MSYRQGNPSRERPNPSRRVKDSRCFGREKEESFSNPSRGRVKDFGRRKVSSRREIDILSLYPSLLHAHARALCVRTREGGVMDFREGFMVPSRPKRGGLAAAMRTEDNHTYFRNADISLLGATGLPGAIVVQSQSPDAPVANRDAHGRTWGRDTGGLFQRSSAWTLN